MSCDTYFDIYNLQGSSLETEVGWSTLCVPNSVKFAILLSLLIMTTLSLLVTIFLFVKEAREVKSWTLRKKVFAFAAVGLLGQAVMLCLNLGGVQSRARYLMFPMLACCLTLNSWYMMRVFIRVFTASIHNARRDTQLRWMQRMYFFFVVGIIFLVAFFYSVMCMIFYDDPYMLNWMYTAAVTFGLLGSAIASAAFIPVWQRLAKLCQGSPEIPMTPDMEALRLQLQRRVFLATGFTVVPVLLLLFPVWMAVTGVDSANPGLQGHFYYHYCYMVLYNTLATAAMIFLVLKSQAAGKSSTTGSAHNDMTKRDSRRKSESSPSIGTFPSFSVEELNKTPTP